MVVLMTDGKANRPYNEAQGRSYALAQAQRAAENRIPIFTIGLGLDADTALLDEIARMTNGQSFIVPGTLAVTNYREQLIEKFRTVAVHRPVRLVK